MSPWQIAIQRLAKVLTATVLCGLVARHKLTRAWAFAPYLAVVLVSDILIGLSPARFLTWEFFVAKETTMVLLKLGLALEIGFRAFRALPGALSVSRAFMAALVLVTAIALVTATVAPEAQDVAAVLLPRAQYGVAWLFAAVLVLALWYRVPLDPLHKAILMGLVPYLTVFTLGMGWLKAVGWRPWTAVSYAQTLSYCALLGYWSWAAWKKDEDPPEDDDERMALHRLQPWH